MTSGKHPSLRGKKDFQEVCAMKKILFLALVLVLAMLVPMTVMAQADPAPVHVLHRCIAGGVRGGPGGLAEVQGRQPGHRSADGDPVQRALPREAGRLHRGGQHPRRDLHVAVQPLELRHPAPDAPDEGPHPAPGQGFPVELRGTRRSIPRPRRPATSPSCRRASPTRRSCMPTRSSSPTTASRFPRPTRTSRPWFPS